MSASVMITGTSWVEAEARTLFVPRLNNAYEQYLFEESAKASGVEYWQVKKFAETTGLPHMAAMEAAFDEAVSNAGLQRKIKKKNGNRVGMIYFDEYGPISFMERKAQIKEMYYSDVFPSFVLQAHNISGYSVRLRAERNAPMQAMQLAKNLIESGDLDVVFVGGINPCYSFFFLSEQLETVQWEKQQGIKTNKENNTRNLNEAAAFVVLESADHAEKRGITHATEILEINSGREYYSSKQADKNPLPNRWNLIAQRYPVAKAHMGLYPSELMTKTESMLLGDSLGDAEQVNWYERKGDSNSLNVLRVLHEHIRISESNPSVQLIHSADRNGFGWNLLFK